jgi:hypothetical protein
MVVFQPLCPRLGLAGRPAVVHWVGVTPAVPDMLIAIVLSQKYAVTMITPAAPLKPA